MTPIASRTTAADPPTHAAREPDNNVATSQFTQFLLFALDK